MMTRLFPTLLVLSAIAHGAEAEEPWTDLFPGKDFSAWRQPIGDWTLAGVVKLAPQDQKRLVWEPGSELAVNGPQGRTVDLITVGEWGDVEVHVEFLISSKSNSGVYFMGRYEVQVYDSFGVAKDKYPGIECGGIYPRWIDNHEVEGHSPRVNVAKAPGEWQTFDVVFRAPRFDAAGKKIRDAEFVKVVHNGTVVHEHVSVSGPTRAAHWNDEKPTGPLLLQGDHGPVAYRHVRVRPLPPQ